MDEALRQHYLQAMGIVQWQPRDAIASIACPAYSESPLWQPLADEVKACTRCPLHKTRRQTVFGVGSHQARLLVVGEAPGENEDRQGEPFVGRAGKLLDAMLHAIGLNRQTIYIANILKCRPPQNRDPNPEEMAECTPYLERQIALIQPTLILAVGRIAAHYLLGVTTPLSRLRGQRFQFGESRTPLLVTYHPAYLLRNPRDKSKAFADLQQVVRWLGRESLPEEAQILTI